MVLLAGRAFGADTVAITDLKQPNLDLARQLGADYTHRTTVGWGEGAGSVDGRAMGAIPHSSSY